MTQARLAYGGMAVTPKRALEAERALLGEPWNQESLERALEALSRTFSPSVTTRSAWYRATVAQNLLRGFFVETRDEAMPSLPLAHSGTVIMNTMDRDRRSPIHISTTHEAGSSTRAARRATWMTCLTRRACSSASA